MKHLLFAALLLGILPGTTGVAQAQTKKVTLPNGWSLTPAGKQLPLGDLPLNVVVSPDKKLLAVTNNGQSVQSIQLVDAVNDKVLHSVEIPKSWYGLHFSADGKKLYASGGNDNRIVQYNIVNKQLQLTDSFLLGKKWPNKISPAGFDLDEAKNLMYVVTKENDALYIIDLATKKMEQFPLGAKAYTCLLSPDRKKLYISLWGADRLLIWDTQTKTEISRIAVGDNPNELLLTKDGQYLYVANANDNSVAVIKTATTAIVEVLNTALYPNAPNGSTTNGMALNETETTLYVANADNNCLAVFDVEEKGESRSKGFIPTGWYPTSVKVVGKKLFVSNGKGVTSLANPYGPNPAVRKQAVTYQAGDAKKPQEVQYIGGLFKGTLSIIPEPDAQQLKVMAKQVYDNTPYTKLKELMAAGEPGNPIPMKVGDASPIKHVFYIIKENRTYDQVLGDLPQGNGDTSLVLFGRKITPNQHALAEQFVLLDNFYVDAEVSADGHNWSTAAYANDYTEKNWPTSYGGRGGTYDFEGQKTIAHPRGGFIWDHCLRAGISYRTYGEFADDGQPNIPALVGRVCANFTSWDESVRDTTRFYQWRHDFDSLVAANSLPQLNTLRFINDHTEGLRVGRPTPFAHVADNDYAVGLFIEHLSKSPVWEKSVVFILEDDAQNGPDHVDAHRSTAYVVGPHVKRSYVDHTMYSTSSMLRTIELILGLPPMSQYDAAAMPMWRCFTPQANTTAFTAIAPNVDLNEKNQKVNALSKLSETFDFSKEDMAPDVAFSEVIWKAVKGENSVMPAPRRSAFVWSDEEEEEKEKEKANVKQPLPAKASGKTKR
ncbi:MAG: bifunctional YncE family protein/alkaline phosphatase family protein [Bacteroidetes bacterium]|uniref:bifunctional YncE family protein/alkaline phosphatase family protein n=1 Tax=Phnomibacter sp. TaxID=2836217 RepID=UPI002FDCE7D8|nr:bifunctional YncE family protein/alkaline phosphatase family protein [Bacteroidota bacterium]